MSQDSPAAILYDSTGVEIAVKDGVAIPSNTRGVLLLVSDSGTSRYVIGDSSGRPIIVGAGSAGTPVGGVHSIQGVSGGTSVPALIEGKYARETTSVPYTVVIGGRYSVDGKIKEIATDSVGRVIVVSDVGNGRTLVLNYEQTVNIGGDYVDFFIKGLTYTVPASYKYNIGSFLASASDNRCTMRVSKLIVFGAFDVGTNVYTDSGVSYTSPEFASHLELEVTTTFGNLAGVTFTVTYTNQDGVAGRTGTAVIAKKPWMTGAKFPVTLQGSDYGIRDVTAVSRVGAETGVVNINGIQVLWQERAPVAADIYIDSFSKDVMIVRASEVLALDYSTNAGATALRIVRAIGVLEPV